MKVVYSQLSPGICHNELKHAQFGEVISDPHWHKGDLVWRHRNTTYRLLGGYIAEDNHFSKDCYVRPIGPNESITIHTE